MTAAGIAFRVATSPADEETILVQDFAGRYDRLALERAVLKGSAALAQNPGDVVIACDTVVVVDGQLLEKPATPEEAFLFLKRLENRTHVVYSGLYVCSSVLRHRHVGEARVSFGAVPDDELSQYVRTREPYDKSGGYAIQGYTSRWIRRIEGDYYTVVGLPLYEVVRVLRSINMLSDAAPDEDPA